MTTMKITKITAPAMNVSPRWKPSSEMPMANKAARHIKITPAANPMEVLEAMKLNSNMPIAAPETTVKSHPDSFPGSLIQAKGTRSMSNNGTARVALLYFHPKASSSSSIVKSVMPYSSAIHGRKQ